MIRWFEIEDVNKGAARFDFQKLEALNGVHMRHMDDDELLDVFDAHPALSRRRRAISPPASTTTARRSCSPPCPA